MNVELVPSFGNGVLADTAGDKLLYAPQTGKRLRLRWIYAGTPSSNTADVVVSLRFGSQTPFYVFPLSAPGVFAHRVVRLGAIGESLIANLSGTQNVYLNLDVEEIA